jgi:septal ring factor EnvC (AmiA/AmiB activator)
MKRIFLYYTFLALAAASVPAQDAAVEERLNKLRGQIEDILAAQSQIQKQMSELARELAAVREQVSSANGNLATQEDVRRLTEKLKEVDRKRAEDNELVTRTIEKLGRSAPVPAPRSKPVVEDTPPAGAPQNGYEHVIQKNDSLSLIVQAYKAKGVKTSTAEILKANPGLNANKLVVGRKIFIPGTKP